MFSQIHFIIATSCVETVESVDKNVLLQQLEKFMKHTEKVSVLGSFPIHFEGIVYCSLFFLLQEEFIETATATHTHRIRDRVRDCFKL